MITISRDHTYVDFWHLEVPLEMRRYFREWSAGSVWVGPIAGYLLGFYTVYAGNPETSEKHVFLKMVRNDNTRTLSLTPRKMVSGSLMLPCQDISKFLLRLDAYAASTNQDKEELRSTFFALWRQVPWELSRSSPITVRTRKTKVLAE